MKDSVFTLRYAQLLDRASCTFESVAVIDTLNPVKSEKSWDSGDRPSQKPDFLPGVL
ncbi:MAG: hypothetical protein HC849_22655 [Oscillatoriales cyanobacterium RU_3_3]|nr:hypothetical protein [Microcoleus sp. SM1_3_4]NJM62357.1 hypothetical protein [Oscillatoriales cyanobacterium RU_3_3]NJR23583.1 hypothetical protein [Richelia sp. CSU_2_1]